GGRSASVWVPEPGRRVGWRCPWSGAHQADGSAHQRQVAASCAGCVAPRDDLERLAVCVSDVTPVVLPEEEVAASGAVVGPAHEIARGGEAHGGGGAGAGRGGE